MKTSFTLAVLFAISPCVFGQSFELEKVSIALADGTRLDSSEGDMQVTGALTLAGRRLHMWGQVCFGSTCASKSIGGSITNLGAAGTTATINWDDRTSDDYSIISRSPLILFTSNEAGSSVEVWRLSGQ